jgi:hypothetical protein
MLFTTSQWRNRVHNRGSGHGQVDVCRAVGGADVRQVLVVPGASGLRAGRGPCVTFLPSLPLRVSASTLDALAGLLALAVGVDDLGVTLAPEGRVSGRARSGRRGARLASRSVGGGDMHGRAPARFPGRQGCAGQLPQEGLHEASALRLAELARQRGSEVGRPGAFTQAQPRVPLRIASSLTLPRAPLPPMTP